MPRKIVKKQCVNCQGHNTKRHDILVLKRVTLHGVEHRGVQRWYCKDCRKPFTPERPQSETNRYTFEVYEKAAILYFDQEASYRAVARELNRNGINNIDAKR